MKIGLSFIGILLLGMYFELFGPSPPPVSKADYSHVILTSEEYQASLDQAKRHKYLAQLGYYHNYFPYAKWNVSMGPDTYQWMIFERLILIWLIGVIYWLAAELKKLNPLHPLAMTPIVFWFIVQQAGDLIDWFLTYNTEYGSILSPVGEIPISYNTLSFLTYVIIVFFIVFMNGSFSLFYTANFSRSNNDILRKS